MKISEQLAMVCLGAWLILFNLQNLLHRALPVVGPLLPVLAIVAGILILLSAKGMNRSLGGILLACWLILKAAWPHLPIDFKGFSTVLHLLGFSAGVLLLLKR